MNAADVMTRRVITVRADTPVTDAVRLMLQDDVSGLPVVDREGRLVGIVTEGDFLRRAELGTTHKRRRWLEILIGAGQLADEYVHTHAKTVGDVMTSEVVTAEPDATLDEVVTAMEHHRVKRIAVVKDGRLVGIVSRADLLRALGSLAPAADAWTGAAASDTSIRNRILAELEGQIWATAAVISVVVWDGSVHLWGTITDEAQRAALRVMAENVSGVREVRDHLVLVEPMPAFIS